MDLFEDACYRCERGKRKMKVKDLDILREIVSEEEWKKISPELKLEFIALSRMTGEDIQNNLTEEELKLYNKLCYD